MKSIMLVIPVKDVALIILDFSRNIIGPDPNEQYEELDTVFKIYSSKDIFTKPYEKIAFKECQEYEYRGWDKLEGYDYIPFYILNKSERHFDNLLALYNEKLEKEKKENENEEEKKVVKLSYTKKREMIFKFRDWVTNGYVQFLKRPYIIHTWLRSEKWACWKLVGEYGDNLYVDESLC